MIRVRVLYFAQLKETLGRDHEVVEVSDGETIDDVVSRLRSRAEWDGVASLPLTFAVNERVVGGGHRLQEGEHLAILTPVSGG